ncbi:hypothetical protein [Roseisolibacter sp. H3M3-2]|uniref:hypothetical protein n=1 Tax=Roseisolibacter sp. H3M3-2 TaxID=3031323 RepID=UPI0023DBDCCF|nr:hypothetical protein [Roseisolibacter sp. H3M3-2]MDF1505329.1 hypothetical protein [Roseisolibacter sp. H3M3-2]
MARWFVDARGIEWEVWEIRPRDVPADAPAAGAVLTSWLCFESATHRRHLSRYPAHWETLAEASLAALCDGARPQPPFDAGERPLFGVEAWW